MFHGLRRRTFLLENRRYLHRLDQGAPPEGVAPLPPLLNEEARASFAKHRTQGTWLRTPIEVRHRGVACTISSSSATTIRATCSSAAYAITDNYVKVAFEEQTTWWDLVRGTSTVGDMPTALHITGALCSPLDDASASDLPLIPLGDGDECLLQDGVDKTLQITVRSFDLSHVLESLGALPRQCVGSTSVCLGRCMSIGTCSGVGKECLW